MGKKDYQNRLRIINELVNPLLDEDLALEVSRELDRFGFVKGNNHLMYLEGCVEIIYRFEDKEEPFSIVLNEESSRTTLEAERILSKLVNVMEDI